MVESASKRRFFKELTSNEQSMIDPLTIQVQLNDLSSGLAERIGRDIGQYTVALLSVSEKGESEELRFCGSGSLVCIGNAAYVMTAFHVWQQFQNTVGIGLTLNEEDVDHRFFMDMKLVTPFGPAQRSGWPNPLGPDMVLLKIPVQHVDRLKGVKKFYPLATEVPPPPNIDSLDIWILIGSPREQGEILLKHASLTINAIYAKVRSRSSHEGLDYVDLDMDTTFPGIPQRFNGMSGGGFWTVALFGSSENTIEWKADLVGMACWQLPSLVKGVTIVRCLGERSIRTLLSCL
jgi:hypothetical protein